MRATAVRRENEQFVGMLGLKIEKKKFPTAKLLMPYDFAGIAVDEPHINSRSEAVDRA